MRSFSLRRLVPFVLGLVLLAVLTVTPARADSPGDISSATPAMQSQPAPSHSLPKSHLTLLVLGLGAMAVAGAAMAATKFGTSDGYWNVAANWDNGVPTTILSAVVSSTAGVPVLPEETSATCKNISGGGTIGLCAGGVNKLNIVTPSANSALRFVAVDALVNETSTVTKPQGHG